MTEYEYIPGISTATLHQIEWHPGWEYTKTWLPKESVEELPKPEGEGWILNVDAGDGGYDRLERIRVAYWRREKS